MNTTTYRALRKDNSEEVIGYYCVLPNGLDEQEKIAHKHLIFDNQYLTNAFDFEGTIIHRATYYEITPSTLAQCTGRQDKNKNWIFGSIEIDGKMTQGGDVVKAGSSFYGKFGEGKVVFNNSNNRFEIRGETILTRGSPAFSLFKTGWDIEIIGRQYEGDRKWAVVI